MSKSGELIIEGLQDAVAFAKIDALWRRTKKKREITQYDWGYRDGVMAARSLFGTEHVVKVPAKSAPRPLKTTSDKQKRGALNYRRPFKNPITGTWTKREDKSGKPFKGVRKEKKR